MQPPDCAPTRAAAPWPPRTRRRGAWLAALAIGLVLALLGVRHAFGLTGLYDKITYVKASNTRFLASFGTAVALSADGNTLAVGAILEASAATGINGNQADISAPQSGAVYIYTRSGNTWVQQAYIKASNTGGGDLFGRALALSADGNTLAVGAASEDSAATGINGDQANDAAPGSGAVYVFTRSGSTWVQQAYVKASNTRSDSNFGFSVALTADGTTLAVGAPGEDSAATGVDGNQASGGLVGSGAVYVFSRSGGSWVQQSYVKASNTGEDDRFGMSIALATDGTTLAVGAWREDSAATGIDGDQVNGAAPNSGAVYVFARSGSTWVQQAYVKASNTQPDAAFGSSIALTGNGNTLAVGAIGESSAATGINGSQAGNGAQTSGAVYVFTRSGGTWAQEAYAKASNTGAYHTFGRAIALSATGSALVVGADGETSAATGVNGNQTNTSAAASGAVYAFTRSGGTWAQQAYVKASNTGAGDRFGWSVHLSADGNVLAVAATGESSNATGVNGNQADNSAGFSGAVYLYEVTRSLSGMVFEDVHYGGGAGRDRATALAAGGSGRPGARVELYDSAGSFLAATTTDSAGAYTFSGLSAGSYTVRVVNGSVSSARAGYSAALLPVQTFRTDASSGTVSAVTGRVGGQSPRLADAGNGSTTLAALSTASTTAQSISTVQVGSSNVGGVDFGFSFNVIVNTNDSGQGSLRQFIANANALSNTGLNINGLTGADVSVFMIPSPADPLGRTADPGYVDGRALIVLTSALPAITGANADGLLLDATTQTSNVGNTNAALLGSGGMVGTPATPLPQLDGPEVELRGNGAVGVGLDIDANITQVSGFALTRFTTAAIRIGNGGLAQNTFLYRNVLGATALAFTDPGAGLRSTGAGIRVLDTFDVYIQETLIGFHGQSGVDASGTGSIVAQALTLDSNEIRDNGLVNTASPGITHTAEVYKPWLNCSLWSNLVIGNRGGGLTLSYPGNTFPNRISFSGNTFSGNGTLSTQPAVRVAMATLGQVSNNVITTSSGAGISLTAGRGVTFSQNAIHGNGGIGIDLGGDGVTANDGLRTTSQPNESWDTPVIESATLSGSTLTVSGYVGSAAGQSTFGGSTVEVFIADATAGNFPAGQTYLGTLTAASNGTFSGQIANVSGVVSGTRLVATAREGSSGYRNTSEFSAARAVVTSVSLSGTVFEDVHYGGGAGRDRATALAAGGSGRPGARVELYDSAGSFLATTTTDSAGAYTFSGRSAGSYTVRVVNGSVSSARAGYSAALLPVQTFRTDASSGTVSAVTGRVGGQSPRLADAGNGSTTLAALSTASTTAQSISTVQVGSSNVGGVDFGFSFNVIVNTNDSGQGSLRQFIANANALSNTGLNINGLTDNDVSVFMIPSPADPLGRTADPGYVDGRALIVLTSALPAIGGTNASGLRLDATTQTSNVGNTNAALLGSGGMVGSPAIPLPQLNAPEVELRGNGAVGVGLDINADSTRVSGFALTRFTTAAIRIGNASQTNGGEISGNVLGTTALAFTDPGASLRSTGAGIRLQRVLNPYIANNLIGFHGLEGIDASGTGSIVSTALNMEGNEIRDNGLGNANSPGIKLTAESTAWVPVGYLGGNLIASNRGGGLTLSYTNGLQAVIVSNTFSGNGTLPTQPAMRLALRLSGWVDNNVITGSSGAGISLTAGREVSMSQNSIHGNGGIGIDLGGDGVTANDGLLTSSQPNELWDTPVITSATLSGSTLTVSGYVGSAAGQSTFGGSTVEVFIADATAGNFPAGQTYLGSLTADASGTFSGQINNVSGVVNGTRLVATASPSAGQGAGTSEFSAARAVGGSLSLSGTVFEDVHYGGGAGRNRATALAAGGSGRPGARVELYDSAGSFLAATTTDSAGAYTFSGLSAGSYTVRVVNGSVSSARAGYSAALLPVQTFRTHAAGGTATAVLDRVGGEDPARVDAVAGAGGTTLAALATAGTVAQSVAAVTIGNAAVAELDFGFSFNLIVNTNDSGQGSLRQLIINANALAHAGLALEGRTAGIDHAVFMIPNGSASPGLNSAHNLFGGGSATIAPVSALPSITQPLELDAQTQPGWTGVPIVALDGAGAGSATGLTLAAAGTVLRGLRIGGLSGGTAVAVDAPATLHGNWIGLSGAGLMHPNRTGLRVASTGVVIGGAAASHRNVISGSSGHNVDVSGDSVVLIGNYIGTDPTGNAALTACVAGGGLACHGVRVTGSHATIGTAAAGNLISGNGERAISLEGGSGHVVQGNRIGVAADGSTPLGNGSRVAAAAIGTDHAHSLSIGGAATDQGNVIAASPLNGIQIVAGSGISIQGNFIGTNAAGAAGLGHGAAGIRATGAASNILIGGSAANVIRNNGSNPGAAASFGSAGVTLSGSVSGVRISANPIYGNAGLAIDLGNDGVSANNGSKAAGLPNQDMDFPVLLDATLESGGLRVRGHVGSAAGQAAFGGATVELFEATGAAGENGQALRWLGTLTADADGSFNGPIAVTGLAVGSRVTATATDGSGNTSEFGANLAVRERAPFRNGSFEDGALGALGSGGLWQLPAASTAVDYWVAGGAGVEVLPGSHTNASHGVRGVHLNPAGAQSSIEQTFDTEVGTTYSVFFDHSGSAACGPTRKSLRVSAAGQSQDVAGYLVGGSGVIAPAGASSFGVYYDTSLFRFTAIAPTTTLRFESLSAGACGVILDNVRVQVADPFVNGQFEDASPPWGSGFGTLGAGSTRIDGWTVGSAAIDFGVLAAPGCASGRCIGLNGNADSDIAQVFDALPETWLRVRYRVAAAAPAGAQLEVHGDGASATEAVGAGTGWAERQFVYRTTGTASSLTFRSPAGSAARVDSVSIESAAPFVNGSFEDVRFPLRNFTNLTADNKLMRGWVTAGASLQHLGGSTLAAASGGYSLHLNGPAGPGSVSQTFDVEPGQSYDILYDVTAAPGAVDPRLRASVSGATTAVAREVTVNGAGWRTRSLSFTAAASQVTLTFESLTDGSAGAAIDNVRQGTTGTYNTVGGFNAFDPATPASAVAGVIRTKVAGEPFWLDIAALDLDRSGYSNSAMSGVRIELLDARDNTGAADANGCRASWTALATLSADFALAAGDNGRKAFGLTVDGAHRQLRLRMSWPASGPPQAVGCSTDAFAVRPAAFAGVQASDSNAETAGVLRLLNNGAATGGVVHKAGRPFSLLGRAVTASGATATAYDGAPTLSIAACLLPAGCTAGTLSGTPSITNGTLAATLTYSEAGVFALMIDDSSFADVDAADGSTLEERSIRLAQAVTVGRFVPDRYLVAPSAATLAAGCAAGTLTFVGQPFGFAGSPGATVVPVNSAGTPLQNARPGFDASMVSVQLTASGAPVALTGSAEGIGVAGGALPVVTIGSAAYRFTRGTTPVAPFAPTFALRVAVADTSESNGGHSLTLSGEGSTAPTFAAGHLFHYGRMNLWSAYGDARHDLVLPMQVQSHNGTGWLPLPSAQSCITVTAAHFGYTLARGSLATLGTYNCNSRVTQVTASAGRWALRLPRPPLPAVSIAEGAMTVHLNTLAGATGQTCSPTNAPVAATSTLASAWLAQPDGTAPSARVQWGRSRGELVQLRERFN